MTPDLPPVAERILAWARAEDTIRAVILVGSHARTDFPADEFSDYDLEFFVTRIPIDAKRREWAEAFGTVWLYVYKEFDENAPHPLVVFEGDVKVDFPFSSIDGLREMTETGRLADSLQRGYRVLIDKDGLTANFPPPQPPVFVEPTQAQFDAVVEGFWYGALYVAKQIRRGNLWVVKYRDWTLKEELRTILEWRAKSTWHDGHFLSRLSDDVTNDALNDAFGRFDAADSWRALQVTMDIFEKTADTVAIENGLTPDRKTGAILRPHIEAMFE